MLVSAPRHRTAPASAIVMPMTQRLKTLLPPSCLFSASELRSTLRLMVRLEALCCSSHAARPVLKSSIQNWHRHSSLSRQTCRPGHCKGTGSDATLSSEAEAFQASPRHPELQRQEQDAPHHTTLTNEAHPTRLPHGLQTVATSLTIGVHKLNLWDGTRAWRMDRSQSGLAQQDTSSVPVFSEACSSHIRNTAIRSACSAQPEQLHTHCEERRLCCDYLVKVAANEPIPTVDQQYTHLWESPSTVPWRCSHADSIFIDTRRVAISKVLHATYTMECYNGIVLI
jgi:hypothetical protein